MGEEVKVKILPEFNPQSSACSPEHEILPKSTPVFMVPSYFIRLAKMPLTSSGKVDRKALPAPEGSVQRGVEFVAPRTAVEVQLARIWEEVLGLSGTSVGVKDNFFDLGGHSLRANILVSKLHKEMGVQLPLQDVFLYPMIEQMAEVIKNRKRTEYVTIPAMEERAYYPVSSAQERLFVLHKLEGGELSYNMPMVLEARGLLDSERLEAALQALIARHEPLRTSFCIVDGKPVQRVHASGEFTVTYLEKSDESAEEAIRSFIRPFDLGQAPLLRGALVRLEAERHLLLLDMHHIISDGTTIGLIIEELALLYAGKKLNALQLQYKEYAVWQQTFLQTEAYRQLEAYWLQQFSKPLPVLNLPADFPRPALRSFTGGHVDFALDDELTQSLKRLARQTNSTLYIVLLSAYGLLLTKLSTQDEVIIGTPVAGRSQADTARMLGMFVNTLALQLSPLPDQSFASYLQVVRQSVLGALENQDYPFEELVQQIAPPRDLSRNPIFDAMFILQNMEMAEPALDETRLKLYPFDYPVAKFDLTLSISEEGAGLQCSLEYASALFSRETAQRWANCYIELLRQAARNPDIEVRSMSLTGDAERKQLNDSFSGYRVEIPQEQTMHGLFEQQAVKTPAHTALVCGGERITYEELNRKAEQLANVLRIKGVVREDVVVLLADRSIPLITGLLAINKAGAAYLPIDPDLPEERIRSIMNDSGCKLVVTQSVYLGKIASEKTTVLLDREDALHAPCQPMPSSSPVSPADLAYVIYTSGSTGKPKGVMIEHRSVHNLLLGIVQEIPIDKLSNVLSLTTVSFDIFVLETLLPLMLGCTVVMATREEQIEPERLAELCREHRIELLQTTPSRLRMLLGNLRMAEAMASLRCVLIGGEMLSEPLLQQVRKVTTARLFNMYGPTETTVWSTIKDVTKEARVTIGRPISNTRIYIVDAHGLIQPVGVPGELCIAGMGVARGYLNSQKLTDERFVPEFSAEKADESGRMYRTGDRARYLNDGTIEYMGRLDDQVKIRGYRVEPGEIVSVLSSHPSIHVAVVVDREDEKNGTYLTAYYESTEPVNVSVLREHVGSHLPAYMIPSHFIRLDHIPVTSNGKINKQALPKPEARLSPASRDTVPRSEGERMLSIMWKEVLGLQEVGRNDNFFELGAHSLHAAHLVEKIRSEQNVEMKLTDFFMYPTIASLASRLFDQLLIKERASSAQERAETRKTLMRRQRESRGTTRT
ncbi:non-ribosomal peptide synthetase [Paenibacillus tyrfis]|uniref:non-ribosomal peptide synthetase n=1 Tax=Paenibacillus tyrfis TaxID=1501230 RepID=UPI00068EC8C7|nr:non-ribosomal peptide synthetase [Paenibacillus tyrfis]